jgi:hypothetical protein
VPMKLVRLLRSVNETNSKVRIGKHLSDSIGLGAFAASELDKVFSGG